MPTEDHSPESPLDSRISPPSPTAIRRGRVAVGTAVRPIAHTRNKPVLHRVEVYVIDSDAPNRHRCGSHAPSSGAAEFPSRAWMPCSAIARQRRKTAREAALDEIPAQWKILVSCRERPHRVQVVGQNADRDRLEREAVAYGKIRSPQEVDVSNENIARPVRKGYREEKRPALNLCAPISRHNPG